MYSEIPQGKIVDIQGLRCWIPPEGYVYNHLTKQLEHIGIYSRSENPEEQYWERIPLPDWFKDTMKRWDNFDKRKKEDDGDFYDEKLEQYKTQEWQRRLNGFWFYNNGKPTYITGGHYFFLQWILIDIGYPKFRIPDMEYYYFQQYCIEDPNCMGMLEITKRRFGKTFRGGAFLLDFPTRTKMTQGGIQSKTGADSKKVFAKAVINPFIKLPKFFRPEYDMQGGIRPKSEIKFQQTNVRGKKAEDGLDKEELGSMIDHQTADILAYDGQKLHRYFADEWAKTLECDIYERHEVIRYCLLDDEGRIIGKALYSSTVEVLDTEKEGVQEAAIKLWNDSDHTKKNEDGRTASGLYRFFMTADRAKNFDKYGIPDVEKTIKDILADRETVKHNQKSWAARVRKEARTIDEAFYAGDMKCEFNSENLIRQVRRLESEPVYLRRCRLILKEEIVKSILPNVPEKKVKSISFMDDEKGGWLLFEEPIKKNQFKSFGDFIEPLNKNVYQIGVDTIKNEFALAGSRPTILVMKQSLIIEGEETGMYPVALYDDKTRLDVHFDEEVLKACMWYGCTANYEMDARTDFYRYFWKKGADRMLEWTPKIAQNPVKHKPLTPGTMSADPFQLQAQLQTAKSYIDGTSPDEYNGHVHRIVFPSVLHQLLKYDHADRTKSDQVIALMMSLLPMMGREQIVNKKFDPKPKVFLPTFQIKKYA